ncbi:MAG: hypothetical protein KF795_10945 [Labilithrix sp.]|nr:hypothetical protein [Labilithrix sp.]
MAKEDDLLPKKKTSSTAKASSRGSTGASAQMLRLMRIVRLFGVLLGGLVTLVGAMSLVGFVTDAFWARLVVALIVVVGLSAFVSVRVLKRTKLGGGLSTATDIFAIVLLAIALVLVSADFASKPLLVREGDRYARAGSRTMARVVYFLGGVSPVFPAEAGAAPAGSGSAGGSASAAGSAPADASAK